MAWAHYFHSYTFEFQEFITGHYVYKDVWTPFHGEKLSWESQPDNFFDKYAVKVVKNTETVGHVPTAISLYMTYILANGGKVTVEVIGSWQNQRENGLEVPGLCKIKGPYVATEKGHLLIKDYLRRNPVNFANI